MSENQPIHILLVEDEVLDQELVRQRLQMDPDLTYTLEATQTLQGACDRLEKGDIDVIVADLSLPDSVDCTDTIDQLCSKAPHLPIVVLTGREDSELLKTLMRKGVQDYIVKSEVSRKLLVRTILEAVERHKLQQENQELRAQLERLARIDPLTEVLNRRGFEDALKKELGRVDRNKASLSIMLIDLDNFKTINDTCGHVVGDKALQEVAKQMTRNLRVADYVGRFGGDEFLILLPDTNSKQVESVAERIREKIKTIQLPELKQTLTASVGVMQILNIQSTLEELVEQLDKMLFKSKHHGKDQTTI